MSIPDKSFPRPKVRFSQSAESPEKLNHDRAFGKPRIRSVTNYGPRVKILKAPTANADFERNWSPEENATRRSAGDAPDDSRKLPMKSNFHSSPCLIEIPLKPENRSSSIDHPSGKKESKKTVIDFKVPAKTLSNLAADDKLSSAKVQHLSSLKTVKKSSSLPETFAKKPNDGQLTLKNIPRTKASAVGKENVSSNQESKESFLKVPDNTPRSDFGAKSKIFQNKAKIGESSKKPEVKKNPAKTTVKLSAETRKICNPKKTAESIIKGTAEAKKIVKTKPTISLMACMKNTKTRSTSAPIKKTILRDASADPPRFSVAPGIPRSKSSEFKVNEGKKMRSREEIHSGDKLSRPEYNSITFTMKKLRDARNEKIVDDIEHLPEIYRRHVIGKVSSALDFGPNEAIYRDLVDLSIDEKQLPSRLTRSKDPEPRQRDIDPKLSDFFVPTYDEEYKRAVVIRPPSPRIYDTWNPYRISDRIFSWKESLDRDL